MATLTYTVQAIDSASGTFAKIALSAKDLEDKVDKLAKTRADIPVNLEDKQAQASLKDLDLKLTKLKTKVTDPSISLKGLEAAYSGIARLDVALARLSAKTATPGVDVKGVDRSLTGIRLLDAALDKIGLKTVTARVKVSVDRSELAGFARYLTGAGGGGGGGAGGAASSGGGLLSSPLGIGAIVGGAALAAGLVPSVVGLGIGGIAGAGAVAGGLFGASEGKKQLNADLASIKTITTALKGAIGKQKTDLSAALKDANKQYSKDAAFFQPFTNLQSSLQQLLHTVLVPLRTVMNPLAAIFTQFGKGLTGLGPQFAALFKASLPFIKQFLDFMLQAGKILLPAFTQAMNTMVKSGALQQMMQGLVVLVQGLADFTIALGPGMAASAQIFARLMTFLARGMGPLGTAFSVIAKILTFDVPKAASQGTDAVIRSFDALRGNAAATWNAIGNVVGQVIGNVEHAVGNFGHALLTAFDSTTHLVSAVWRQFWEATVGNAVKHAFDNVTNILDQLRHAVAVVFGAIAHSTAAVWNALWAAVKGTLTSGVNFVTSHIGQFHISLTGTFNSIKTTLSNIWHTIWSTLESATRTGISRIGSVLNGIKNAFMTPIRWVVSNVLTPLVNVWDKIAGAVGQKNLVFHLPAFAEGGKVTAGTGPTADDVLVRVSKGETIVSAAHSAALAPFFRAAGVPGYAGGGKVGQNPPPGVTARVGPAASVGGPDLNIGNLIGKGLSWVTGHLLAPITGLLGHIPGTASGVGQLIGGMGKTLAGAVAKGIAGMISGLGASGSAIVRDAMSWLGKIPYVWGGTAVPGGADCSGFVQTIYGRHGISAPRTSEAQGAWVHRSGPTPGGLAFYNSPAGGPPPGHVAIIGEGGKVISQGGGMGPQLVGLHAFPLMWTGVPPGGLSKPGGLGRAGAYSVAGMARLWQQVGGAAGVAHLMGAIGMAESGGDPRAHNPSGASGLWQILGLPFPGNPFIPATNARMALSKYRSQGLGAWSAYTNGSYRQFFDRGGLLMPGVTLAVNNTGAPEHVVPNSGQGSMAEVVALLRQILRATQLAPAATSVGMTRALNGMVPR